MTPQQFDEVYEALALQIDTVGPHQAALYLAKLALLLAERLDDTSGALAAIKAASRHLTPNAA